MGIIAFLKKIIKKEPPKKKLGLALGSGGAKGLAHLGALTAFEEAGITFDVVTGTSIGSIVGALYARGYSARDMYELVKTICLREYVRFVHLKMDLAPIEEMLNRYLGDAEFSDLKIPYACWATDEKTNEGVLLDEGSVAKACTASSAMPPFFKAVNVGGRALADGAFTNAVPSDAAKKLGADFVVGIELSAKKYNVEGKSSTFLSAILGKLGGMIKEREEPDARTRGYDHAEVMLEPNLKMYKATDLNAAAWQAMFDEGYTEAKLRMPEIIALMKRAGFLFPLDNKYKEKQS